MVTESPARMPRADTPQTWATQFFLIVVKPKCVRWEEMVRVRTEGEQRYNKQKLLDSGNPDFVADEVPLR